MTVPPNADSGARSICAELGRCAYDVANDEPHSFCPYWHDCFPRPSLEQLLAGSEFKDWLSPNDGSAP